GEAEARPRLLQGVLRLRHPQLEIGGRETGDHLALPHRAPQVDRDRLQPAGDFHGELGLLFRAERSGHRDDARQPARLRARQPHLAAGQGVDRSGFGVLTLGGFVRSAATTGEQQKTYSGERTTQRPSHWYLPEIHHKQHRTAQPTRYGRMSGKLRLLLLALLRHRFGGEAGPEEVDATYRTSVR